MIAPLSNALAERGYTTLTDVQQAVSDPALAAADLLVSAQTGSGKTVGFGLAIAPTLLDDGADRMGPPAAPLALVIAPTRELALQVQRELEWLYAQTGARVVSCIGGMDARDERRALDRGAHIVVGTPGRLRDHITRGALNLDDIRAIVLDEADEMLDLGFREDLEFMLAEAPADRRTLLFSATVPPSIAEMAKQFQRDAVRISTIDRGSQHSDITYQLVQVAQGDGEHAIINLLRFHDAPSAIVFANTRAAVARLTARLANRGMAVVSLSGELSQDERSNALQALRDGRARVCVATDVAARGIDLPKLELVIHADLPSNTEALLHRSGRTGRAGRKGISALIASDKAMGKAKRLLKWAKIEADFTFAPGPEDILARDEERLLADPAWTAAPTGDEAGFAAKLVAQYTPEQIAAACLRLYRANLSAPEELNTRAAARAETARAEFGPSVWLRLSVGRAAGAEVRWLLPLVCRVFDLDKGQVGKVRIQPDETFVEIAEGAAPALQARLANGDLLEGDVRATLLDGVPDAVKAWRDAPRGGKSGPAPGGRPKRRFDDRADDARSFERKPRPKTGPKPSPTPKPAAKPATSAEPAATPPHKARAEYRGERSEKPAAKPGGKPAGKPPFKPRGDAAKPAAKPKGKPAARAGASDPSKRMERPGKPGPRPGGKPRFKARGGESVPRRKG